MIPIKLRISGFLSYRDPVEVDFTGFDLACISGANGAGKSTLLDAMTWSLFGQARKRDESLINTHPEVKAAEVTFDFAYEGAVYRVQRTLPRGKTTLLEFHIRDGDDWRPLSERTMRETQARIEAVLRLDYETFINAAFFLQGKADQFTQQNSTKRKEVLSNILGLEAWEGYKKLAGAQRSALENKQQGLDGRLGEIDAELAEEPARKASLEQLEAQLKQQAATRKTQQAALESLQRSQAALDEQRRLVETLRAGAERAATVLTGLQERLSARQTERGTFAGLVEREKEVRTAYQDWQAARAKLEEWDRTAAAFQEQDALRQKPQAAITAEQARLEQELDSLRTSAEGIEKQASQAATLRSEFEAAGKALAEAEAGVQARAEKQAELRAAQEAQSDARSRKETLETQIDELKERIQQLESTSDGTCPLCGQPLEPKDRKALITKLKAEEKELSAQMSESIDRFNRINRQIKALDVEAAKLAHWEEERIQHAGHVSQAQARLEAVESAVAEWKKTGAKRLAEVEKLLAKGSFAAEARKALAEIDKELKKLGYDAASHDLARRAEQDGRSAEAEFRELEAARAALAPLEREIVDLEKQAAEAAVEQERQEKEYQAAQAKLEDSSKDAPDLESAERQLFDTQEEENRLNQQVGAARQKVAVLDDLRARKSALGKEREALGLQIGRLKTLETAFGKNGVPALLIEQALPQIEARANELLDRLSDGRMSVRFVTQEKYKDDKRADLRETLEIQISDGAGTRDYEMFSGGEAFRVNFAIRLALAEVLAQRKGARLQTLVIDEGFGSQDAQGRQRLIEAINLVKDDFAKILVITHLEELKDAFPTRIEVEKTERGSEVRVM